MPTDGAGRSGPGRALRDREPRGHADLRARQDLHRRRHLGDHRSDNFNRRSWTHDSELSAVVLDTAGDYARTLRLTLAAEHLTAEHSEDNLADCVEPTGMFAAYAEPPRAWTAGTPVGRSVHDHRAGCAASTRPTSDAGPEPSRGAVPFLLDPDGRPKPLRKRDEF